MICIKTVKRYCNGNISNIENYEMAINDTTQTWHCHHKLETELKLSVDELINRNLYYDRPASELIFLPITEHLIMHTSGENNTMYNRHHSEESKQKMSYHHHDVNGINNPMYNRHHSEESKQKISNAKKCKESSFKGKHHSEETKQKLCDALKGKPAPWNSHPKSEETKQKLSDALKGKPAPWNSHPRSDAEKQKIREGKAKSKYKHWKLIEGKRIWY